MTVGVMVAGSAAMGVRHPLPFKLLVVSLGFTHRAMADVFDPLIGSRTLSTSFSAMVVGRSGRVRRRTAPGRVLGMVGGSSTMAIRRTIAGLWDGRRAFNRAKHRTLT
jgi:hypothetical protein